MAIDDLEGCGNSLFQTKFQTFSFSAYEIHEYPVTIIYPASGPSNLQNNYLYRLIKEVELFNYKVNLKILPLNALLFSSFL